MSYTQVVVLALIRHNNTYLFTLRNDGESKLNGKWQIPGGGLEFGETPEQTLHREVKEELGTEIKIIHSQPFIDSEVRGNWHGIFLTYLCELKDSSSDITINEEASEYKWMSLEEMNSFDFLPGCKEIIEMVAQRQ